MNNIGINAVLDVSQITPSRAAFFICFGDHVSGRHFLGALCSLVIGTGPWLKVGESQVSDC